MRHGTARRFNAGCLCDQCRAAHSRDVKGRKAAADRGEPARMPAIGAQRRLRGLMWMGWPLSVLAERGGVPVKTLENVLGHRFIYRETHEVIDSLFVQLRTVRGPSDRQHRRAARRGDVPPLWWGARIDDPDATPRRPPTSAMVRSL